jgi:hypothetical protein
LDNTEKRDSVDRPTDKLNDSWWARFVFYLERKMSGRAAKRREETAVDRAARITASATFWIAIFTLVSLLVSVGTFLILKGQLKEMHDSGTDTHDLAVAAGQQAIAANTQSQQAIAQTSKMSESLKKTDDLIKATNVLAVQAKRQADAARDAMSAAAESSNQDRRPWVGLQSLQCNNCKIETDGSFVVGDLSAFLVNTGKTPAVDMIVTYDFISIKASEPIPTYDLIEKETVPPNLPPDVAASVARTLALVKRSITLSKEVLAPNASRGITIIARLKQERKMMANIEDQNVVYGLGKITYYDTIHTIQHTTMFCVMNEVGASFRFCPSGNQMN